MYKKSRFGSNTGFIKEFFDMFSIDFTRMCSRDRSILYANDTVLVSVGTSLKVVTEQVDNSLHNIFEWCNCNKLFLNPSK